MVSSNPVIAHRGAWKERGLPENSIASLREAINLKCAGSEFDVFLTADNILVVNHDSTFYGLPIESSTYQQLLCKKHPNGETISIAEAYLQEGLKQSHTKLIFELKQSEHSKARTLQAAEMSANLVKSLDKNSIVEFISFDYDALKKIKEIIPNAEVSYLNGDITPKQVESDGLTGIGYNLSVYKKNPSWIHDAQAAGLNVNVWTVDEKEDMLFFINQGVDYITTDFPAMLLDILMEKNNQ